MSFSECETTPPFSEMNMRGVPKSTETVRVKQWVLPVTRIAGVLSLHIACTAAGQSTLLSSVRVPSMSTARARINPSHPPWSR